MLELRQSADLSFSAYSAEFDECYHSLKEGALKESLHKHIQPAFAKILQNLRAQGALQSVSANGASVNGANGAFGGVRDKAPAREVEASINILDICFGLGYNSFATLLYYATYAPKMRLKIYSPEKDCALLDSLLSFPYPSEFSALALDEILHTLINHGIYKGKNADIELYKGDALEYVKSLQNASFDIIYHDAFSPRKNPALWSEEYFMQCFRILKPNGILTTYSQSAQIRQNAINCGFFVYDFKPQICEGANKIRGGTLLLKEPLLKLENYILKSIAKRG
ncbi:hypothetical protein CQA49_02570 [Helicobacter sp. MIT 00-7814]|uniref:tRNA (5-methylaminomethyl-2-thiouridine)(34)-methyltransferase MnmD n=1 Tax=unclassified Helicobacter TaxID=2593540 RepID=UPI000E1E4620|nr:MULTISPECIES: MnmC family methyltransferase [unclassified Helicobacter]RDU55271.1 hypothetical protein CQA37_04260 [Helicobacter sp. MIT 99-10781]RDU56109.1 hypothetical protein CQA49_02570 [Helicobacter sp. MIT 00-7814]